jgi:CheY-like chemotaxis protein
MSDSGQNVSVQNEVQSRVLLVEDDPLIRKSIARLLEAAAYVVQVAVDGLDALRKLREGLPDMIISDLQMPHMSGAEFLDIVRERFPQIPVIVISGVAAHKLPEGVAADAYCPKDESLPEQLLDTVSALIEKPHLRTPPPPVDNEPAQARWDGNGHYIVSCADCLREFSVPRAFHMGRNEAWAICVHCGRFARFLVAEESEAR